MNNEISFLLGRFPGFRDKILDEYTKNDEFRSLCDDFYSSARILEDKQKKLMNELRGELEYRRLFVELEQELAHFLDASRQQESNGFAKKHR